MRPTCPTCPASRSRRARSRTTWPPLTSSLWCYTHLVQQKSALASLQIILSVLACTLNCFVIALIYFNSISWTVFDQILIGHCFIQGFTAGIDIPFFHIQNMFGYWPLPKLASYFWASYDNNINTTTNLNMLFMCWARLRSIVEPTKFKDEFLIKHPKMVIASFWALGLGIWTPVTIAFNTQDFSSSLDYKPLYLQNIINFLFWFSILFAIIVFSLKIIFHLYVRSLRKMHLSKKMTTSNRGNATTSIANNRVIALNQSTTATAPRSSDSSNMRHGTRFSRFLKKKLVLKPQVRYLMIILIYWIQWFIPCVTALLNGLCNCVSTSISAPIYWLT